MNEYEALLAFKDAIPKAHRDHWGRWQHGAMGTPPFTPDEAKELALCSRRIERLDRTDDVPYTEVMELMRLHAGITYRKPPVEGYKRRIRALMGGGVSLADFERVFKFKHKQYADDPEWLPKICNPETLLTKFDKYLSEAGTSKIEPKLVPHRKQDADRSRHA